MNILVTGGAGYIGSHVSYALAEAGKYFVVIDDLSAGARVRLPAETTFVRGDVGDDDLVFRTIREHGISTIIHLAASVSVEESFRDIAGYFSNNVNKMRVLLQAAIRAGVRNVLFSSSATVYGNFGDEPIPEDAPIRPISPYGQTKAAGELLLQEMASNHHLKFGTLRFFNVAGADPLLRTGPSHKNPTHLISVAIDAALRRRDGIQIFGTDYPTPDGTCMRDYIHVSDLAGLHLAALARLGSTSESFTLNCGYGRGFSVFEVIAAVKRVSGNDFSIALSPRRPGDPASLVANTRRLNTLIGRTPCHNSLDSIVRHALAWEKRRVDI